MSHRRALAAAIATGIQVGAAMVATRAVAPVVGPATLALLRYVVGFLCLAWPAWVALLFATFPLMTMVLAAALGRERLTLRRGVGVGLTVLGVGLAMGAGILEAGDWRGEAAILGAALCGAACSIGYRPYLARYAPVAVSAAAMLASVAFLAVLAAATEWGPGGWGGIGGLSAGGWAAVLFIGLGSGAGYFLWLFALKHLPATEVTMALALGPLTAIGLSAVVLGESVEKGAMAGFVAVTGGIWLATARRRGG